LRGYFDVAPSTAEDSSCLRNYLVILLCHLCLPALAHLRPHGAGHYLRNFWKTSADGFSAEVFHW